MIHASQQLAKQANELIRKQVKARIARWGRKGEWEKIENLAGEMPDSVEKFYAYQAAAFVKPEEKK